MLQQHDHISIADSPEPKVATDTTEQSEMLQQHDHISITDSAEPEEPKKKHDTDNVSNPDTVESVNDFLGVDDDEDEDDSVDDDEDEDDEDEDGDGDGDGDEDQADDVDALSITSTPLLKDIVRPNESVTAPTEQSEGTLCAAFHSLWYMLMYYGLKCVENRKYALPAPRVGVWIYPLNTKDLMPKAADRHKLYFTPSMLVLLNHILRAMGKKEYDFTEKDMPHFCERVDSLMEPLCGHIHFRVRFAESRSKNEAFSTGMQYVMEDEEWPFRWLVAEIQYLKEDVPPLFAHGAHLFGNGTVCMSHHAKLLAMIQKYDRENLWGAVIPRDDSKQRELLLKVAECNKQQQQRVDSLLQMKEIQAAEREKEAAQRAQREKDERLAAEREKEAAQRAQREKDSEVRKKDYHRKLLGVQDAVNEHNLKEQKRAKQKRAEQKRAAQQMKETDDDGDLVGYVIYE